MAKINQHAKIEATATFTVDEEEMRALDAMVGYGFTSFMDTFKKHMGSHYMSGTRKAASGSLKASAPTHPAHLAPDRRCPRSVRGYETSNSSAESGGIKGGEGVAACGYCIHWRKPTGTETAPMLKGECRRHAPVVTGGMMSPVETVFPLIEASEVCGEFEAKDDF